GHRSHRRHRGLPAPGPQGVPRLRRNAPAPAVFGLKRSHTMSDCLFCKIRDGQIPAAITYRDEDVLAFKDINPRAPFHQLVVPLKHISTLGAASQDDAELLGKVML